SGFVLSQLRNCIDDFRTSAPIGSGATIAVAAAQADLVAYSLGGLVSRGLVTIPGFVAERNYRAGYVHKLITLDTPHLGSQLATNLLATSAGCRVLFNWKVGPVGQNVRDLEPGSDLLRMTLNTYNPS